MRNSKTLETNLRVSSDYESTSDENLFLALPHNGSNSALKKRSALFKERLAELAKLGSI